MRIIFGFLFFSCCLVVFLFAVVASLFFSSSGAGETQTALRFVVPLVFSSWPRSTSSTRTSSTAFSPRPPPRTCFLLFVLVVWFCCQRLSLSLSLSHSLWFRSPVLCMQTLENTLGWPIRRRPPTVTMTVCWVGVEHRTVARTNCPELSVLPPLPPAVP